jgi:hypothetical protein
MGIIQGVSACGKLVLLEDDSISEYNLKEIQMLLLMTRLRLAMGLKTKAFQFVLKGSIYSVRSTLQFSHICC